MKLLINFITLPVYANSLDQISIDNADVLQVVGREVHLQGNVQLHFVNTENSYDLATNKLTAYQNEDEKLESIVTQGDSSIISDDFELNARDITFYFDTVSENIDYLEARRYATLFDKVNGQIIEANVIKINFEENAIYANGKVLTKIDLKSQSGDFTNAEISSEQQLIYMNEQRLTAENSVKTQIFNINPNENIQIKSEKQKFNFSEKSMNEVLHAQNNIDADVEGMKITSNNLKIFVDNEWNIDKALIEDNASLKDSKYSLKADQIFLKELEAGNQDIILSGHATVKDLANNRDLHSEYIRLNPDSKDFIAGNKGRVRGELSL